MISCTRTIEFDAAHRVLGTNSKCRFLHGHRYKIEATFVAKKLDTLGMVIDFGIIKEVLGKWVDDNWDHNTILNNKDLELGKNITSNIKDQKVYYLDCNPTAENMAYYLYSKICPKLFTDYNIICQQIRIYETPNCFAVCDGLY
jgi:6-pyruvoyltetrahydropterin/6-carboxytetrahydropterin synthase